jgi:hypothetical protein
MIQSSEKGGVGESERDQYQQIFGEFRSLLNFQIDFKRMFGIIINEEIEAEEGESGTKLILPKPIYINCPFDKVSDTISHCENLFYFLKGIDPA